MITAIGPDARAALFAEAVRTFPRECCGVVVGQVDDPATHRFVAFENLADKLHAADPEAHPRDARTAFAMHPLKLQRLVDATEAADTRLVNRVFEDDDALMAGVRKLAQEIAGKSPLAIRGIKTTLLYGRDHSLADSLEYVANWNAGMLSFDDVQAAVRAAKGAPPAFED